MDTIDEKLWSSMIVKLEKKKLAVRKAKKAELFEYLKSLNPQATILTYKNEVSIDNGLYQGLTQCKSHCFWDVSIKSTDSRFDISWDRYTENYSDVGKEADEIFKGRMLKEQNKNSLETIDLANTYKHGVAERDYKLYGENVIKSNSITIPHGLHAPPSMNNNHGYAYFRSEEVDKCKYQLQVFTVYDSKNIIYFWTISVY